MVLLDVVVDVLVVVGCEVVVEAVVVVVVVEEVEVLLVGDVVVDEVVVVVEVGGMTPFSVTWYGPVSPAEREVTSMRYVPVAGSTNVPEAGMRATGPPGLAASSCVCAASRRKR